MTTDTRTPGELSDVEKDAAVVSFIGAIGNGMALSVSDRNKARQAAEYLHHRLAADRALAARPAAVAVEPTDEHAWQREGLTLTARQLAEAILLATGDTVTFSFPDMVDTEVTIAHAPEGYCRDDDNKPQPAGLVAWLTDYPEEGCTPLPDPLAEQAREAFAALTKEQP